MVHMRDTQETMVDIVNVYMVSTLLSEETLGHDNTIVTDDGDDEDDEVYLGGGELVLGGQEGETDDNIAIALCLETLHVSKSCSNH